MLGSWDFMVLSSDNDTGIVYTFQVPQSVIRQRLQITRSIETYAYPEIISICDLCVVMDRQGIYIIVYTDRALADCFSRVGRLRRAVPCRGLCCLPRSAPRRLRLPTQHHAVFTLAAPPRTHGRRAARPQLQSPHGRWRTAAAMRPVARDPRHLRRNRPNLGGVEVVAETLQHIYRVTDAQVVTRLQYPRPSREE